jgi:hypothetical protein
VQNKDKEKKIDDIESIISNQVQISGVLKAKEK